MRVTSFEAVREISTAFVVQREWGRFHLPTNVCLALSGEAGEIVEIFQWKTKFEDGKLCTNVPFTEEEQINIGEEIADVFIYTTRLCEICRIDLPYSVRAVLQPGEFSSSDSDIIRAEDVPWNDFSFEELSERVLSLTPQNSMTQRQLALSIQTEVGKACDLFRYKSEVDCSIGLVEWQPNEVASLSSTLGSICIFLACLARASNHELGTCIGRKFNKNALKYPVELAKGKSDKYTAYTDQINKANKLGKTESSFSRMGVMMLIFIVGFTLGKVVK
jgi:dCTP diphosphatase